jgi:hypothetical protein
MDLLDSADEEGLSHATLREYCRQLKAYAEHISFIFMAGITKYVKGGLFSDFNSPIDISLDS